MIFSACLSGADAPSSRHWPLQWFRECEITNKRSREPKRDGLNNSREQNWRLCSNDTVQVKVTYHELMIRFSWMTKKAHGATQATTNHRKTWVTWKRNFAKLARLTKWVTVCQTVSPRVSPPVESVNVERAFFWLFDSFELFWLRIYENRGQEK